MNKIEVSDYKWFLKFYVDDHQCLAEDYAGMQKVITLFQSFIHPAEAALVSHLKTIRRMIEQSQHLNHGAQTSIHHRLQGLIKEKGNIFKRLRTFLCSSEVDLGLCYLILQEEEQVHTFLQAQHKKLKVLLKQMYEPALLKHLSRVDLGRVQSLEIFLKRACHINKGLLKDCKWMRKDLKEYAPHDIPTTSFQSLMQHCNSWGSKANTIPLRSKSLFKRVSEQCSVLWEVCVFLWD
ncbi:MAG: hypothetical protein KA508_06340 [Gammaproteobacteria bacterium]|nr:hypothetical protein [Gammaproteobacteria bacterium]